MNQIASVSPSFTPAVAPQSPLPGTEETSATDVHALDSAAWLDNQAQPGKADAATAALAALISNSNGAPSIGDIVLNFSAEDLSAALLVLQGKTQDAQLRTAKEGLGVTRLKMEENHKKALEKIDKWIKKCESAAAKSKLGGIFGWIGKIAAFLASAIATIALAVATPVTGGAAGPLLALAVVGLVGSTMSLASSISQAAGGPALEISTLMSKACLVFLKAVGVPEDKLEAASRVMAGAIGFMTGAMLADPQLLGGMLNSVAQLTITDQNKAAIVGAVFSTLACVALSVVTSVATGAAGAGKSIADITKSIPQLAKVAQHVAGAVSAVSSMATAGMGIGATIDEHAAASAQVERKLVAAMLVKLQAQLEEDQELIKKVVQEIQDALIVVSQMIAAAGESRKQIASNIGRSMA